MAPIRSSGRSDSQVIRRPWKAPRPSAGPEWASRAIKSGAIKAGSHARHGPVRYLQNQRDVRGLRRSRSPSPLDLSLRPPLGRFPARYVSSIDPSGKPHPPVWVGTDPGPGCPHPQQDPQPFARERAGSPARAERADHNQVGGGRFSKTRADSLRLLPGQLRDLARHGDVRWRFGRGDDRRKRWIRGFGGLSRSPIIMAESDWSDIRRGAARRDQGFSGVDANLPQSPRLAPPLQPVRVRDGLTVGGLQPTPRDRATSSSLAPDV